MSFHKQKYIPLHIGLIVLMLITNVGPLVKGDTANSGTFDFLMYIGQAVFILGFYWYVSVSVADRRWWIPIILFQLTVIWGLYGDYLLRWLLNENDSLIYVTISYSLILIHYFALSLQLFFLSETRVDLVIRKMSLKVLSYTILGEIVFDLLGFFLSYVHYSELWKGLEILHSISYFQLAIVFVLVVDLVDIYSGEASS